MNKNIIFLWVLLIASNNSNACWTWLCGGDSVDAERSNRVHHYTSAQLQVVRHRLNPIVETQTVSVQTLADNRSVRTVERSIAEHITRLANQQNSQGQPSRPEDNAVMQPALAIVAVQSQLPHTIVEE